MTSIILTLPPLAIQPATTARPKLESLLALLDVFQAPQPCRLKFMQVAQSLRLLLCIPTLTPKPPTMVFTPTIPQRHLLAGIPLSSSAGESRHPVFLTGSVRTPGDQSGEQTGSSSSGGAITTAESNPWYRHLIQLGVRLCRRHHRLLCRVYSHHFRYWSMVTMLLSATLT
jgi:hypothetical protein